MGNDYYDLASAAARKPIPRVYLSIASLTQSEPTRRISWTVPPRGEKPLNALEILAWLRNTADFHGDGEESTRSNRAKVARLGGFATHQINDLARARNRILAPMSFKAIHKSLVVVQNGLVETIERQEYPEEPEQKELHILDHADWILGIQR